MSSQPPYGYNQGGGYPPPPPPPGDGKTKTLSMGYNVAALLCYLPTCLCCVNLIFSILWLATEPKENHFVRFHALQGLLLFGLGFVINILFQVLGVGVNLSAPGDLAAAGAGGLLFIVQICIWLVFLILHIIGMVKANQGVIWKIPVIGDIADKNA
jgi:uncharacterized membrane protein